MKREITVKKISLSQLRRLQDHGILVNLVQVTNTPSNKKEDYIYSDVIMQFKEKNRYKSLKSDIIDEKLRKSRKV